MKTRLGVFAVVFGLAGTLALPVLGQSNAYTSMVKFSLKTLDGSPQSRTLTIAPDGDGPESYWNDLFWGPALTASPTNGMATVWLAPDDYVATLAGCQGSIAFTVGTNLGVFNVLDLATNVPGYLGAMAGPATVVFQLRTLSGAAPTRSLTISQVKPGPLTNGTNIVWGASLTRSATNGLGIVPLEPQGYTADLSGGAVGELTFYVPTDGGTYNVASLPSVMPTNATVTPTNLIAAGAWYSDPPHGGGYRSFTILGITGGDSYALALGNATELTCIISISGFPPTYTYGGWWTNDGTFTAPPSALAYSLQGPADWSPTGPYQPIAVTTTIIGPQ